jgi:hypothetical protein
MGTWSNETARSNFEGKWLSVQYKNINNKITNFLCAIKDILPDKRQLNVDVSSYEKGEQVFSNHKLNFNSFTRASVIEGTHYPRPEKLINKITGNYSEYQFLSVHSVDEFTLVLSRMPFFDSQGDE